MGQANRQMGIKKKNRPWKELTKGKKELKVAEGGYCWGEGKPIKRKFENTIMNSNTLYEI